jgi:hypothetical protein
MTEHTSEEVMVPLKESGISITLFRFLPMSQYAQQRPAGSSVVKIWRCFRVLPVKFDFAFFYGFFYRILGKAVKPLKIERLFCPDYGLEEQFQIVVTPFAYIPMGQMKVIAPGKGIMYGLFANIAGKGFHGIYTPC